MVAVLEDARNHEVMGRCLYIKGYEVTAAVVGGNRDIQEVRGFCLRTYMGSEICRTGTKSQLGLSHY